jgi:prepilin-type N-terminal cleavage/methylation domain-containing protein|tara:strand:- start:293 stop:721 length:429 start_codon:yes stop_codon:yes gene_type:complete
MKNSTGFTLVELVVTIALVGILLGTTIPTFYRVVNETQEQVNLSNMGIIKNTFMQYYYDNHMAGNPHFPQVPTDSLLNDSYRQITLEDGRTPDMLFSGDLPYNTNNKPYIYYWDNDSTTKKIIIKDNDSDSPSYEKYVIGEI